MSLLTKLGFKKAQYLVHGIDTSVTTEFDRMGINFSGGEKQKSEIVNNTFSWLADTNVYVYNLSPLVRYANLLENLSKEGKRQINKGQNLFIMTQKRPFFH